MRSTAPKVRFGQDRQWGRRLGRVTGHLCPAAAIPPAVKPRCTGWIRVPSRSRRAGHALEPMRHRKAQRGLPRGLLDGAQRITGAVVSRDILHP